MVDRRTKLKKQGKKDNEFNNPLVMEQVTENERGFKICKAEDGIPYAQESRGIGNVYRGQYLYRY